MVSKNNQSSAPDIAEVSDSPELTDADFARTKPFAEALPGLGKSIRMGRGPNKGPTKKLVSLRLQPGCDRSFPVARTRLALADRRCASQGRENQGWLTPKKVRPALGGELAAREPVWDGEGWGCDRVACSIIPCQRELAVETAGRLLSPSATHTLGSLWD